MQLSAKDVIGKTMMTSLAVLVGVVNGINLAVSLLPYKLATVQ